VQHSSSAAHLKYPQKVSRKQTIDSQNAYTYSHIKETSKKDSLEWREKSHTPLCNKHVHQATSTGVLHSLIPQAFLRNYCGAGTTVGARGTATQEEGALLKFHLTALVLGTCRHCMMTWDEPAVPRISITQEHHQLKNP
jgi:hypothetical protein